LCIEKVEKDKTSGDIIHWIQDLGSLNIESGMEALLCVDSQVRRLHSRLHSAGHAIDVAIERLGLAFEPSKAYHFPDGPFVEYVGEVAPGDKDSLIKRMQDLLDDLVMKEVPVRVLNLARDDAFEICRDPSLFEYGEHERIRVIQIGAWKGCRCGGTHVSNTKELGRVRIEKLQKKGKSIKFKYSLSNSTT
jgi:Ser-tRNA(Ala) deacylase AlaX